MKDTDQKINQHFYIALHDGCINRKVTACSEMPNQMEVVFPDETMLPRTAGVSEASEGKKSLQRKKAVCAERWGAVEEDLGIRCSSLSWHHGVNGQEARPE